MAHQYDLNLSDYERIFRKRYKMVIVIALMVTIFSIFFSRMKPSIYKASSSVKVDRRGSMGAIEGGGYMAYDYWDNIETQTKVITSFPVIKKAAIIMKLIPDSFANTRTVSDPAVLGTLGDLGGKVSASAQSGTNIIQIDASSDNAKVAQDVANAFAEAYKEFTLEEKRSQVIKTKKFIEAQLELSKNELGKAENAVKEFEEHQKTPSISAEMQRIIDKVSKIEGEIEKLSGDEKLINLQRTKLKRRLESSFGKTDTAKSPSPDTTRTEEAKIDWISEFTSPDPGLSQLNGRLLQLQINLEDQLIYYKRDHPALVALEKSIKETIKQILAEYNAKLKNIYEQKASLSAKLADLNDELDKMPGDQMQYARLLRQLKVNEEIHTLLTQKLQETLISEAGVVDDVVIMSVASLPSVPINKDVRRLGIVGLFLGLLLGIILAIFREMLDTSIGTIEDVERFLELPVLAAIPHIHIEEQEKKILEKWPQGKDSPHLAARARLITHFDPKNPAAEAYRILRTNIHFLTANKPLKTILFTSTSMQEGKSTTIANLSLALAQEGKSVLLIGCNLRRPSLYKLFGLEKGPGVADVLIDKVKWQDCVRTVSDLSVGELNLEDILSTPGLENLHIITFGQIPPNPTELISSKRMDSFLEEVKKEFDFVLIDSPPLLPVADASILATKVDGVLLVYQVGKIPRNSLARSKERLENVKAHILGLVLNDIRPEVSGASYVSQYYMHYYGEPTDRPKTGSRRSAVSNIKKNITLPFLAITGNGIANGLLNIADALKNKFFLVGQSGLFKIIIVLAFTIILASSVTSGLMKKNQFSSDYLNCNILSDRQCALSDTRWQQAFAVNNDSIIISERDNSFYTVQLYSWKSVEKAKDMAAHLQNKGLEEAYTDSAYGQNDEIYYRVCAGHFANNMQAKWFFAGLDPKKFKGAFIVNMSNANKKPFRKAHFDTCLVLRKEKERVKLLSERKTVDKKYSYGVQIYSFRSLDEAKKAGQKLYEKESIKAWIEQASIKGKGVFYRVSIGRFYTSNQAKEYLDTIGKKFKGAFVTQYSPLKS